MKLNIRTKLLLAFALILVLGSAVNIYSLIQMNVLAGLTTKIYNHPLQVTRAVLTANAEIIKMHRSMKDVALASDVAEIEAAHTLVKKYEQEVYKQFEIVQKWILGEQGAALIAETIQAFQNWSPFREEMISLMKTGQREKASAMTQEKGAQHVDLLNRKMDILINYAAKKANGIYENAQATRSKVIAITLFSLIVVIILSGLLGLLISSGIVKSVQIINAIANQMVTGKIATVTSRNEVDKLITFGNEMGDIGRAFYGVAYFFKTMIEDIIQVSQELAKGNLHAMPKATYQGDFSKIKEALETALSNQCQVVEDIIQVSQGLAESEQRVMAQAEYKGDFLPIKNTLETASAKLAKITAQNKTQNWLKTGQTQLNDQMSGEQDMTDLAKNVITFLATYLEMPVGMFYLFEEAQIEEVQNNKKACLKLIASYAYIHRKGVSNEFFMGDGLIGQAALEKKAIHITKVPNDYYVHIQSGLGKSLPRNVIVQPFLYEDTLKGIIELASFKTITEIQLEFLNQIMPNIGIAVNTAESRSRMQVLLQQSQTQTEELQTQSEELQTQQEELSQTNEELEARTKDLERQKGDVRKKNLALEKNQDEMKKAKVAIENKAQELELASKYKSEFLANMSHELRTPLNSLLILAQLLSNNKEGNLTSKQIEYVQTIHSAGSDLLTLINEILDLSKVEAGKIEVNTEEVSLTDLVEKIEQKFHHVAEDKGLAFHVTIADDLPSVISTDGQRVKQIINNMLSNAFKFTAEGEINLDIRHSSDDPLLSQTFDDTLQKETGDNFLAISVMDTGVGIPKAKQLVIFEAFQQVDGTTSRRYGGTGLGLSISRQLARLLGGDIKLDSEEGKGSTFTLYLPEKFSVSAKMLKPSEINPLAAAKPMLSTKTSTLQSPKVESLSHTKIKSLDGIEVADDRNSLTPEDKSLLIIEDDSKFSKLLMKLAQEKEFKCLIADDGKTGLQLAEEYLPNAIILDIGLPQLDGWTVMERLKDNPDTRHIPVHFMSAFDQGMEAKKMGAIGHLLKPISVDELGEAFKKIEGFINKTHKNLLVIAENEQRQQEIFEIVKDGDFKTTTVATMTRASQELQITHFDCIILDIDIEQQSGIKMLEQQEDNLSQIPIIIYAERELTEEEETILQCCNDNVIVKAVKSPERLLDEATLFLHQIKTRLPDDKQQMLQMIHDKEAILTHKKVLIVDDDIRNTFALATVLEEKEMLIVVAETGKEALEKLEEHEDITIVLMDIMMPEMDGYETMQEIRKKPRFHKLPIIALTAKAMKGDKVKCIEAGASDYLAKPVDTEKLISLMRVWLYR
ncbi:response regulator [Candidatus Parabeggiatoa sp. HSG14]|uniref:response regulator n=1 Tax=Candidatus Parabeggiatoa sp. HSG14 TaxID=3055593 RepID=UPI0025A79C87|nr:response regulator [Thiotrichales bacterium HSG14]